MKEKELIIFDYDGVLVDSVLVTFKAIIEAVRELNVKEPDFELLKEKWGICFNKNLFPDLAKELGWSFLQQRYILESFFNKNAQLIYPLPDSINQCLKTLKERDYKLAILTNRKLESLIYYSYKSNLNLDVFESIVCPQNGLFKPDPKVFNYFWQKGHSPEKTVFIGDSIKFDLASASSHLPEIDFIAITSGLNDKCDFIKAGVEPELIFDNPSKILEIL